MNNNIQDQSASFEIAYLLKAIDFKVDGYLNVHLLPRCQTSAGNFTVSVLPFSSLRNVIECDTSEVFEPEAILSARFIILPVTTICGCLIIYQRKLA